MAATGGSRAWGERALAATTGGSQHRLSSHPARRTVPAIHRSSSSSSSSRASLAARHPPHTPPATAPPTHHPPPPDPDGARPPPPPVPGGDAGYAPGAAAPEAQQLPLFLVFNGQKYRIDKEKFIIGRGSQMTDLTIRDGNISRKHAAIIYRGGKYFLKDLDSTNGIDYQGSRIDSKKIEEGDVFHICDYELRFTFQS